MNGEIMSEKRFEFYSDENLVGVIDNLTGKTLNSFEIVDRLNEQQNQIIYWKHKVTSLLWILSQFDEEKVKELLKELEDE